MQNSLKFPEEIKYLPPSPGVYLMKDDRGKVIYVGKAKSILHRVNSYKRPKDPKTYALSERVRNIEFIVTSSEDEALLLENNLIKKHLPYYNIRLVDDENYPYIKITDEKYPRIMKVYRIRGENGEYFGPFPHGRVVDTTIKTLRKVFPIRSCNVKITEARTFQPCLLYHIGLCNAPCAHKVSEREYKKVIDSLKLFLKGEDKTILERVKRELESAKNEMDFERAIIYRDSLKGLLSIMEKQRVVSNNDVSFDLFACELKDDLACIVKISVRNGRVNGTYPFIVNAHGVQDKGEILSKFLTLYPFHAQENRIYLESSSKDRKTVENFLNSFGGKRTKLLKARGDEALKVLSLARENARLQLKNYIDRHSFLKEEEILMQLKEILKLSKIPRRIEGYDISNVSGKFAVGSMVVFTNAHPDKKEYRKFKIKFLDSSNDYGMLLEVLSRRFTESKDFSVSRPDLMLIDGGKGQLDAALKIKKVLSVDVDVASLAKKEEKIFSEHLSEPVVLPGDSEILQLLQRIRDESHRFAKAYFKVLHSKQARNK